MKTKLEIELQQLESEKLELDHLRAEFEVDQKIHQDLQRKLAEIDEAIILLSDKIKELEDKLAKLKE